MSGLFKSHKTKAGRGRENAIPASVKKHPKKKVFLWTGLVLFLGAVFLFSPKGAHAISSNSFIITSLGAVAQLAVEFLGKLLIAVIDMLVQVAQYNDFGDSAAVNIGWVVTRDLANMLFIVALIVISFGTVLQWEQYRYNRLLGKLVITVVIVNFSKAITLFLIDFSQVIMMTFVNAFRDVAAGNLTTGFGIRALLSYADSSTSVDINLTSTILIYALAIILILVALIVTITLVVILIRRIISLWIIIILSPLAFISSIMPGGVGSYNAGWWKRLGQEMFVGPALAFFLWLSFSIIFLTSGQGTHETAEVVSFSSDSVTLQESGEVQATVSQIGSTQNLFNFIAVIVLLIYSMETAKQAGGFAGKFASSASGWIDKGGSKLVKGIGKAPKKLADFTGATGVAKRTGFGAADMMLAGGSKIPLIGNRIAVARGRLAGRRRRSEEQDKKDLTNVSKDALMRMANGRGAITERGRALQKGAIEALYDAGDADDLTPQSRQRYEKLIGYSEQAVRHVDEDTGQVTYKLKRNAREQDGYARKKKAAKEHLEFWYDGYEKKSPELQAAIRAKVDSEIDKYGPAGWGGVDGDAAKSSTSNPIARRQLYEGFRRRYGWDVNAWPSRIMDNLKEPVKRLLKGDHPATDNHETIRDMSDTERVRRYDDMIADRNARHIPLDRVNTWDMTKYASERAKNPAAPVPAVLTVDQQAVEDIIARGLTPQQAYDSLRSHVDDYGMTAEEKKFEDDWMAHERLPGGAVKPGSKSPLVDATPEQRERFENEQELRLKYGLTSTVGAAQMREAAEAHKQNALQDLPPEVQEAFNAQLQKNKTPDQIASDMDAYERESGYSSEGDYKEARAVFEQRMRDEKRQEEINETLGKEATDFYAGKDPIARLQSELDRAEEQGRASTARFIANFDKLGLDTSRAGLNITGDIKKEMIPKLQELFRAQLQEEGELNEDEINARVEAFGQEIDKAENLAIANSGRQGYTTGHVLRHENAHAEIDKLSAADKEQIFSQLPQEEQDRIIENVATQWGMQDLPDDQKRAQAIEEYLTEGLANYGRSDAVGSNLDSDLALALKSKGVKFRSYTDASFAQQKPTGQTRDQLEAQKRQQETKVARAEQAHEQRKQEIAQQLPPDVEPDDLTNPNELVQKELDDKGISKAIRDEMNKLNETLRIEQKALNDINDTLKYQIRMGKEQARETGKAIKSGMKSAQEDTRKVEHADKQEENKLTAKRQEEKKKPQETPKAAPRPVEQPEPEEPEEPGSFAA